MPSRILVPIDDSEMAEKALRYAFEAHPDAEFTVLHVVGEPSSMMGEATALALSDDIETAARERGESVLEGARDLAAAHGVEVTTDVRVGAPSRVIVDRAADFDTVIVGTHGGSLADRLILGNVAEKVSRHSPVPVTIVR